MNVPADLLYTKSHEWVKIDGDVATIGITDHAQSELGDIVYLDLPNVGRALRAGEILGSIESVKTVSDVYAPISGEVTDINEIAKMSPENVNSDPYGDGWLIKVKMTGKADGDLMNAEAYEQESAH
ncbi:MAG: glycine cleavage system protein GcvH [Chthonomonas sp.]|nr:glycine cleavage system protein GcvH [Chthonomonas sp.]